MIERLPGWAAGYAYSMYLATGGRIGERMFKDVLSRVSRAQARADRQAPEQPGEFLVYHFEALGEDGAWLNYLQREALTAGGGPVPHESERQPVIQAQVQEIARRQQAG